MYCGANAIGDPQNEGIQVVVYDKDAWNRPSAPISDPLFPPFAQAWNASAAPVAAVGGGDLVLQAETWYYLAFMYMGLDNNTGPALGSVSAAKQLTAWYPTGEYALYINHFRSDFWGDGIMIPFTYDPNNDLAGGFSNWIPRCLISFR